MDSKSPKPPIVRPKIRSSPHTPATPANITPRSVKQPFPYKPTNEYLMHEIKERHMPRHFEIRNMISRYVPEWGAYNALDLESELVDDDLSEVTVFNSKPPLFQSFFGRD